MNPNRFLTILFATLLLAGCTAQVRKDTASPYYPVPGGSTLKINRMIEIPPPRTRHFLQNGKVSGHFDHYTPNCNIEVYKRDDLAVQYVQPGEYRISRVQQTREEVVRTRLPQLAALGAPSMLLASKGDGNASIYLGYHLWLEGPDPNVMRLSCRGAFADPSEAYPPSIDQIRQALGEIMFLELASEGE